jgi:glycosyltransferase involved in cell wall biosynthesis
MSVSIFDHFGLTRHKKVNEQHMSLKAQKTEVFTDRKKLLIVTAGLQSGGAEALLVRYVFVALQKGWRVQLISMMPEGFHDANLRAMGAEVISVPMGRLPINPFKVADARKVARAFGPDVIQGWMYRGNFLASLISRVIPKRLFWGIFCTPIGSNATLAGRLFFRLQARMSKGVESIVYNGTRARDEHQAEGFSSKKPITFLNGVDVEKFSPDPDLRAKTRAELGLRDPEVAMLVAARVHPQKDWPTIIEATRRCPEVTVIAAGADTDTLPDLPNLKRLGVRRDMIALYNAADIFALPSAFGEGTSVAMSEAMATGLPGIATDVGDNKDAIGDAGIVVPIKQPDLLVAAMQKLARDPEERRRLATRAREIALETFDDRKTYQPIFDAYDAQ